MAKQFGQEDAETQVRRIAIPVVSGNPSTPVASLANPWGVDVYITRAVLVVDTIATAACTVDAGVAADATTSADNLFDGLDVHSATGYFDNLIDHGTNGLAGKVWTTSQYVNVTKASGNANSLVGRLFVEVIPLIA